MTKPLPLVLAFLLVLPFFSYSAPMPGDDGNRVAKDKHITAPAAVVANFTFALTGTCMPIPVSFTDRSTVTAPDVIVGWLWDFGDGTSSTLQNPSHTYNSPGSFTVKLTVTSNSGSKYSVSKTVIIPNAYKANIPLPTDTFKCATSSITLDAGVAATSYMWIGPDFGTTRVFSTFNGGSYELDVDSNGCTTVFFFNLNDLPATTADFSYLNASCSPVKVSFSDLSKSCSSTIVAWDWDFGDGSLHSSLQNPVHTYAASGKYNVILTATGADGAIASSSPHVVIAGTPAVRLGRDTSICSDGLTLDGGNNGLVSYAWSTGATTRYIRVNTVGKYWVTESNNGCTASDTIRILGVTPSVRPAFSYSRPTTCAPLSVTFKDLTQICNDVEFKRTWTFGDGSTRTETYGVTYPAALPSTITHSYAKGGSYTVRLSVMNASGTVADTVCTIVINDGTVRLGRDTAICPGSTLTLDGGAGATSYNWSTGATTQTIAAGAPGKYWVTVSNGGCTGSDTIRISQKRSIFSKFGYKLQGTCLPIAVQFTDSSTTTCGNTIAQWSWDFADAGTATQQNPLHNFAAGGTYNVRMIVTDNLGIKDTAVVAVVIPNAVKPTPHLGRDTSICPGTTVQLDAGVPGTSYTWSTGATTQTINVSSAAKYWVRVDNNGCSASDTINITAAPPVTAKFGYTLSSSCLPVTATFKDSSVACGATITGWQWDFGDGGTATVQNPTHVYTAGGAYTVKLTATSSTGNTNTYTNTVNISFSGITVKIGHDTAICASSPLTLDAGNPGAAYLWSTGATTQKISVSAAGKYWVRADNGVCRASDTVNITLRPPVTASFGFALQGNCLPLPAKFSDSSATCGSTITSWNWDFGDGNTTTAQNPTHAYAAGTYTVKLTVTDNTGATSSTNKSVTIAGNPTPYVKLGRDTSICAATGLTMDAGNAGAAYTWSTGAATQTITVYSAGVYSVKVTKSGCTGADSLRIISVAPSIATGFTYTGASVSCLPATVKFTDTTSSCAGTVSGWAWNFGDGGTSTQQHPSHAYASAGTYTVTLTATNSGGYSQSQTQTITVTGSTRVNLGPDTAICEGTSVTLNAGAGSSWIWNTGINVQTITVRTAGPYMVNVTNGACSSSDTIVVTVTPSLTPQFSYAVQQGCGPVPVKFKDASLATCSNTVAQWRWDFGDGYTSSQQNPLHNYLNAGTYKVILKATDNRGFYKYDTQAVVVNASTITVKLGNDTTVCGSTLLTLDAGNPGATYAWSTGETTQKITVSASGTYTARVVWGTCSSSGSIRVNFVPAAAAKFGYNMGSACLPVPVTFTDSTTVNCSAPITGWSWDFGDGNTSTQQNPRHSYAAAGTFNVRLTVTSANGTMFNTSGNVTITNTAPNVKLGNDLTTCTGAGVLLDAGNPGASYKWTPAASLSTDTVRNPVAMPAITTMYKVSVTKCMLTSSDSIRVVIANTTKPVIVQNNNRLVSSYALSYQWYKDGEAIPGAIDRTFKPGMKGFYGVKVSSSQGCEAMSDLQFFVPSSDLDPHIGKCRAKLSPNPGHGIINVYLDRFPESMVFVTVVDVHGRKLFTVRERSQAIKLNMTPYTNATYFVIVIIGNDMTTLPLTVL